MKRYTGAVSFANGFSYSSALPMDDRSVVATKEDLKNPQTWVSGSYNASDDSKNVYVCYQGMAVSVVSEKTTYIYLPEGKSASLISTDSSWQALAPSSFATEEEISGIFE